MMPICSYMYGMFSNLKVGSMPISSYIFGVFFLVSYQASILNSISNKVFSSTTTFISNICWNNEYVTTWQKNSQPVWWLWAHPKSLKRYQSLLMIMSFHSSLGSDAPNCHNSFTNNSTEMKFGRIGLWGVRGSGKS